jgi:Papain family cysteine protease
MFKINTFAIIGWFLIACLPFAQAQSKFQTGFIFDASDLQKLPRKAVYRNGTTLPQQFSLKSFCSAAPAQNGQTCVAHAFANAYTIHANAQNAKSATQYYSPEYIYAFAKPLGTRQCEKGVDFVRAIKQLKTNGLVRATEYKGDCDATVPAAIVAKGKQLKPTDLPLLFGEDETPIQKSLAVKKALKEQKPVVTGWGIDASLRLVRDMWAPNALEMELHAMTIVGYDDQKYGGAFELMNSWGPTWANQGFTWVRYADFEARCKIAVEVPPLNETVAPDVILPKPAPIEFKLTMINEQNQRIELEKMAELQPSDTRGIGKRPKFLNNHFVAKQAFYSKQGFQLLVDILEPTFVYILSTDTTKIIAQLMPEIGRSGLLSEGQVQLPSSGSVFYLDDNIGTDYMCILLSKEELDINKIQNSIQTDLKAQNSFLKSVEKVLGDKFIHTSQAFGMDETDLKVTATGKNTIFPVIIQIQHL